MIERILTKSIERTAKIPFPKGRSLSAVRVLVAGLLLSGCQTTPEKKPQMNRKLMKDEQVIEILLQDTPQKTSRESHDAESLYYKETITPSYVNEEAVEYVVIGTNTTAHFRTLAESIINDPRLSLKMKEYLEGRLKWSEVRQAERAKARLEIAYCEMKPEQYENLKISWNEYREEAYERKMFLQCDLLVVALTPIVTKRPNEAALTQNNKNEILVNQVGLLSQRLREIEYHYLLSTLYLQPGTPEERACEREWSHLQKETDAQLQLKTNALVRCGQMPLREPEEIPE